MTVMSDTALHTFDVPVHTLSTSVCSDHEPVVRQVSHARLARQQHAKATEAQQHRAVTWTTRGGLAAQLKHRPFFKPDSVFMDDHRAHCDNWHDPNPLERVAATMVLQMTGLYMGRKQGSEQFGRIVAESIHLS
jgi:hypothetical protein